VAIGAELPVDRAPSIAVDGGSVVGHLRVLQDNLGSLTDVAGMLADRVVRVVNAWNAVRLRSATPQLTLDVWVDGAAHLHGVKVSHEGRSAPEIANSRRRLWQLFAAAAEMVRQRIPAEIIVRFSVAPSEADPQVVHEFLQGRAMAIMSNDSDVLFAGQQWYGVTRYDWATDSLEFVPAGVQAALLPQHASGMHAHDLPLLAAAMRCDASRYHAHGAGVVTVMRAYCAAVARGGNAAWEAIPRVERARAIAAELAALAECDETSAVTDMVRVAVLWDLTPVASPVTSAGAGVPAPGRMLDVRNADDLNALLSHAPADFVDATVAALCGAADGAYTSSHPRWGSSSDPALWVLPPAGASFDTDALLSAGAEEDDVLDEDDPDPDALESPTGSTTLAEPPHVSATVVIAAVPAPAPMRAAEVAVPVVPWTVHRFACVDVPLTPSQSDRWTMMLDFNHVLDASSLSMARVLAARQQVTLVADIRQRVTDAHQRAHVLSLAEAWGYEFGEASITGLMACGVVGQPHFIPTDECIQQGILLHMLAAAATFGSSSPRVHRATASHSRVSFVVGMGDASAAATVAQAGQMYGQLCRGILAELRWRRAVSSDGIVRDPIAFVQAAGRARCRSGQLQAHCGCSVVSKHRPACLCVACELIAHGCNSVFAPSCVMH